MDCHVLLIEDEPEISASMTGVLEARGCRVTTAASGTEALDCMRSNDGVDLVLLDLMLPDINGWEVRETQLDENLLPDVPVVIISGVSNELEKEQAVMETADHLTKPVRPAELYELLETYCGADGGEV